MEKNIKITTVKEIMTEAGHTIESADVESHINGITPFDYALIRPATFVEWLGTLCVSKQLIADVKKAIDFLVIRDCQNSRNLMIQVGGW